MSSNSGDKAESKLPQQELVPAITTDTPQKKREICISTLIDGCVNAYVDLFYLTHRSDRDTSLRTNLPAGKLDFLREKLVLAEKSHRRNDADTSFAAFFDLAEFYMARKDYRTAVYFYEKCLDNAENSNNVEHVGLANHKLGLAYEEMGSLQTAIGFFEYQVELALMATDANALKKANEKLLDVYKKCARLEDQKSDPKSRQQAILYYKKTLSVAAELGDLESEGATTYFLGVANVKMGNLRKAIEFHQRYLEICKHTGDQIGEGAACAALAHSFKKSGDVELATKYLERYLEISTRNQQEVAQAEACAALGTLYHAQGKHSKSVAYFKKTFDVAQRVGNKALVDKARIHLGMARGSFAFDDYMNLIQNDLSGLLDWKTKRKSFLRDERTPDQTESKSSFRDPQTTSSGAGNFETFQMPTANSSSSTGLGEIGGGGGDGGGGDGDGGGVTGGGGG